MHELFVATNPLNSGVWIKLESGGRGGGGGGGVTPKWRGKHNQTL